jgi:hypothetical protein
MITFLLLWAIACLLFVLFMMAAKRLNTPHPEPAPDALTISEWLRLIEQESKRIRQ